MPKFKESSVGTFVRDILTYERKPPKRIYAYEMWQRYDDMRTKSGKKSMAYPNFLKYIWVLKKIGLIKPSPAPIGQKFAPSASPMSESVPEEWQKVYYQLNYPNEDVNRRFEILNHPAWTNPFKYYRILKGSEKYFSSVEKKHEWQAHKLAEKWNEIHPLEKITDKEAEARFDELTKHFREAPSIDKAKHPSHKDTTLIRISNDLKKAIDIHRGIGTAKEKSINAFLIDALIQLGLYP